MGRTNPTFRLLLRSIEGQWEDFRRALRHPDQRYFDRLFEYADRHADASTYHNGDDPLEPVLISMLLEQEKGRDDLERRLDDLENLQSRLDDLAARLDDLDALERRVDRLESVDRGEG